jgi:hypothetical protein
MVLGGFARVYTNKLKCQKILVYFTVMENAKEFSTIVKSLNFFADLALSWTLRFDH